MIGANEIQPWLLNAFFKPLRASRRKGAPWRQLIESRGLALDCAQALHTNPRNRAEQRPGVWMLGIGEHGFGRPIFNNLPRIKNRDVVGNFGNDADVVGDKNDCRAVFFLKVLNQFQHLGL